MDGLTIGEVAAQARVHIETLRYYERRGLIERPPRSVSNYRSYPEDAVRRVSHGITSRQAGSQPQWAAVGEVFGPGAAS
jgi:DNA-binding transcriptional MerR regulator